MADLSKQYLPAEHESKIYQLWEDNNAFKPNQAAIDAGKDPYVIMLPPPNITGALHLGHALQDTIMDILSRYHRMTGAPVLWLPGTDHAAIGTNKVLENQLHEQGKTRQDIGRKAFLELTEDWYDKTGKMILSQMKRLGCSCDWSRERFTMDDKYVEAVNEAFIRYYQKGYIYRGSRIVNWDPDTQTTVSDLEIEYRTEKSPLYTLKYGPFEISTARPETKFGDKYVVMHPDDKRYQKYQHGDTLEANWINGSITATVIKDKAIDPTFGTGVMTITPWHDNTDFEIAQRHDLDSEQIIDYQGKLLPIAGEFAGQSITEARPKIVGKLKDKGLLVDINEKYEHNIALNDRGKGVIEPQIMRQWFVDMSKLKNETINVAEQEDVRFIPPRWKKHFIEWMNNVLDWNINRQIWLGHRLPVWWKKGTHGTDQEEGSFVVSITKPEEGDWEQDPDVLDTWFSSALWPFATLGWPNNTDDLKRFYPSSVLVTARDILYLWVARMVFSGLELMQGEEYGDRGQAQRLPFKQVLIHPTVLNHEGRRMSKSLGTGVDPLKLINEYGADATRFGLIYQMSYDSQAIKFDEPSIKTARNFANKIWNIARFLNGLPDRTEISPADKWIQSRSSKVTLQVTTLIEQHKLGEAAHALYDFAWQDFADWYIEILKNEGSTEIAQQVFKNILVLLHPFMPHLTEVLWQHYDSSSLLIVSSWASQTNQADDQLEDQMISDQNIVEAIRSSRVLLGLSPALTIKVHTPTKVISSDTLAKLTKTEPLAQPTASMKQFPCANGEVVHIELPADAANSIKQAKDKLNKELTNAENLLSSQKQIVENMRDKAPAEKITAKEQLIAKTAQKIHELTTSLSLLE